jgi:hypothetical protein
MRRILRDVNMDVIREETLSLEPLDEILASMPNACFDVLIPVSRRFMKKVYFR